MRRWPRLSALLVLALALQWGGSFVHCLGALSRASAEAAAICGPSHSTAERATEDGKAAALHHAGCPFCQGLAAPPVTAPDLPGAPVAYLRFVPPPLEGLPTAPARAPPQQPRAPPIA
jgi:hypothetical protein